MTSSAGCLDEITGAIGMLKITDLPKGKSMTALDVPYFPTKHQLLVWRNWGLVPVERLAAVLRCTEPQVVETAEAFGLDAGRQVDPLWLTDGYLTIIRNNWHLLDYEDLLELLGWTCDKLYRTLREEDFCFVKLGDSKPECGICRYRELTAAEKEQTSRIREIVRNRFPVETQSRIEPPFAFADAYEPTPVEGNDKFQFNYIHSYAASCGDIFLHAGESGPVPENLLAKYASMGVKGVWMHALLYSLVPIPCAEEFSTGYEKRISQLRRISDVCRKHGLKLYLYLNEPRSMPAAFYDKMPDWRGIAVGDSAANCISRTPKVLEWLENACREVFAKAPSLGGVYVIAMSENATHCNYGTRKSLCPYCKDVPDEEFLLRIIGAMERGIHASAPDADVIFSDWAWSFADSPDKDFKKKVIARLPQGVCYATISEWGMKLGIGGIENSIIDYSISQVGPNPENAAMLGFAKRRGLRTVAKIQINNSWELSAVPYIPVPYLIERHLDNLAKLGVDGLMLSWTLGGFPGGNLALLRQTPEEMAKGKFHAGLAERICDVWKTFSDAFAEFPFDVQTIYKAPMNFGPAVPFYLEPTGRRATMVGFPYDDLTSWRSVYPVEVFENQFRVMTEKWRDGLMELAGCAKDVNDSERAEYEELATISKAAYCHLRSTYLHIVFVRARDAHDIASMERAVREEMELALNLLAIVRRDSRIGFEASNHYYYTINDLMEKVVNCEHVLSELGRRDSFLLV
ncbi:MAG: hypothetical protein MJ025_04700 [Victivallaceae bacterium]|nr:hypothetical protein [Victivallaceae bacterium]